MNIGYATVSTQDQNLDLQTDALTKAGCELIFKEKVSGKSKERSELLTFYRYAKILDTHSNEEIKQMQIKK